MAKRRKRPQCSGATTIDQLRASDRLGILLRGLWRREPDAIIAGTPIKQWRVPPDLVPTSGTELDG